MGISLSEYTEVFHVPYGVPNNDGTPEGSFINVKANPEWISVLPSCLGWPEIQRLLRVINAPSTPLMSLAADQGIADTDNKARPHALTSFVSLCLADIPANTKSKVSSLATFLREHLTEDIQHTATALQRTLHLQVRLEIQPTQFHDQQVEGWSLMILLAAAEPDKRQSRQTWNIGLQALEKAVAIYSASQDH